MSVRDVWRGDRIARSSLLSVGRGQGRANSQRRTVIKYSLSLRDYDTAELYVNGLSSIAAGRCTGRGVAVDSRAWSSGPDDAGGICDRSTTTTHRLGSIRHLPQVKAMPGPVLLRDCQINGTTGYEEAAAGQGAVAGLNAGLRVNWSVASRSCWGERLHISACLIDDLVTKRCGRAVSAVHVAGSEFPASRSDRTTLSARLGDIALGALGY